jgi:hypothetical protein
LRHEIAKAVWPWPTACSIMLRPGREVGHVVLVDHRRHDDERVLAHLGRLRLVLEQLEHGVRRTTAPGEAATLRPTSKAERSTIVGMRGERDMSPRDSPAADEVQAAGVDRRLERRGVVSGALVGASASSTFSAASGPGARWPSRGRRRRSGRRPSGRPPVGLRQPVEERVLLPRRVLEPPVALVGRDLGTADRDAGEIRRQPGAAAGPRRRAARRAGRRFLAPARPGTQRRRGPRAASVSNASRPPAAPAALRAVP